MSFLFALSLALESWSVGRGTGDRRAPRLAPLTVRRLRADGSEAEVPVSEVRAGYRFIVPAGERIALASVRLWIRIYESTT